MNSIWSGIVTILVAIIGVAIVAVLVSKNANTSGVISSGGNAFAQMLGAAEAPVTGGSMGSMGLSMPGIASPFGG